MANERRLPCFYARQSPIQGGGYGGWGVWERDDDVYVWVKRDVTAERIAEAVAAVLNAIVPNDTHARELREQLRPTCDFF